MDREYDDDMFDDLEKTLCEGITTLRFDRVPDTGHLEVDVSCLEDITNLSKINGPAVRSYNLYKGVRAYKDKRYLDSIYYETFAMSLCMRIKFHANKIMDSEHHMPTDANLANLLEQKHEERPEIIDYLDRFLNDQSLLPTNRLKSIEFDNGTEMMKLCNQLPDEWTVIQLCKTVNTEIFRQTRDETMRHPGVIFLTLFRYPMSERFDHQPIKIDLNQTDLKELYESAHDLHTKINQNDFKYCYELSSKGFNEIIISKLKKLLGPWLVCFSGKSRSSRIDDAVIDKVDLFLAESDHKFSKLQITLICLIARRVYMLSKDDIKEGALFIAKTQDEYWDLQDFFEDLKLSCSQKEQDCYPVILIVDEHIDFMFWEMCNLDQEFTRVDSLVALLKLFFDHQDNISNGYFNVKGKKGSAVLNPDRTLPQFKEALHPLMKILPSTTWNYLVEEEPQFTDLKSMLAHSDVYVYCGHGGGLQFISSYETCQLSTNAVVFLMGCSSVAFHSDHGYSLANAAHHCYHIAKSPAVIGHLTLTYVGYGSIFCSIILGKWFSHVTDLSNVKLSVYAKELKQALTDGSNSHITYSPYLSKVICQIRKKCNVQICFRAILCHRGLPVKMV